VRRVLQNQLTIGVLAATILSVSMVLRAADKPVPAAHAGPSTETERLDMEMVRRHGNFGYSDEEIRKYFDYPQVFEYDATGLAPDRIKAPPAAGIHPRVLFHPDDLPALRRKLSESKPGKLQMDGIRAMLTKDLTGPGARFGPLYDAAIRGQGKPEMLEVEVSCAIIYEALNVSMFDAGDMYESMGKNFLLAENLIPVADRGTNLLALKKVRTQVGGYYLHAMDPWGGHFTFYDSLGGRGNTTPMFDLGVMKHLFPNDPGIDFVYRNTVGEGYDIFRQPVRFGHPFHVADGLVQAIFAEEYAPKTWDQARADATAGKPLTFFSDGTGNLITRTTWEPDAVQLHFLTRSVTGGHQYADRTSFSLYGLGRYWAIYKPLRQVEEHYQPKNRSVVLIDGEGPGMTMGRCVAMADEPQATFIVADAKTPWEWDSGGNNRFPKGGERITAAANDFRLHRSELPWMNMPFSDLPYWQTSMKGSEQ
jgi:hypothetical protein